MIMIIVYTCNKAWVIKSSREVTPASDYIRVEK
jgi:hypothetical protein